MLCPRPTVFFVQLAAKTFRFISARRDRDYSSTNKKTKPDKQRPFECSCGVNAATCRNSCNGWPIARLSGVRETLERQINAYHDSCVHDRRAAFGILLLPAQDAKPYIDFLDDVVNETVSVTI